MTTRISELVPMLPRCCTVRCNNEVLHIRDAKQVFIDEQSQEWSLVSESGMVSVDSIVIIATFPEPECIWIHDRAHQQMYLTNASFTKFSPRVPCVLSETIHIGIDQLTSTYIIHNREKLATRKEWIMETSPVQWYQHSVSTSKWSMHSIKFLLNDHPKWHYISYVGSNAPHTEIPFIASDVRKQSKHIHISDSTQVWTVRYMDLSEQPFTSITLFSGTEKHTWYRIPILEQARVHHVFVNVSTGVRTSLKGVVRMYENTKTIPIAFIFEDRNRIVVDFPSASIQMHVCSDKHFLKKIEQENDIGKLTFADDKYIFENADDPSISIHPFGQIPPM